MVTPVQPTNIHQIGVYTLLPSSNFLKENNLKKRKFMNNRFPKLKAVVYRYIQFLSFIEKAKMFFSELEQARGNRPAKIIILSNIFTYIYYTTDIWGPIDTFSTAVKKKVLEINLEEPNAFTMHLLRFGYICPYPKRSNQEICGKEVDGTLCRTHSKCQDRLHSRISVSLPSLPTDLCNIIFQYSLPYSRLR